MRAVFSGGGTAGHINPALSIAKKMIKEEPNSEILFVGTPRGMENRLVEKEGFPIRHVEVQGFRRKLSAENIKAAYLAITSVGKAKKILKSFRPDVVIGTGGYVSWPVLRAAAKLGIPTLIHEQNAFPGLTTRKLSAFVDRVCISYEKSKEYFSCKKEKIVVSGNPINPEMETVSRSKARSELGISAPFVLSYGGSLGASAINETVFEMAKSYSCKKPIFHTHAFGVREYEAYLEKEKKERICRFGNVKFSDYIYDMPKQMAAADLVISRSGAITLSELSFLGKPAILIPSPNVTDNHQYKNALVYQEAGAAVLIEEKDLNPEGLIRAVSGILSSEETMRKMSENMKKLAKENATGIIWNEIKRITKRR